MQSSAIQRTLTKIGEKKKTIEEHNLCLILKRERYLDKLQWSSSKEINRTRSKAYKIFFKLLCASPTKNKTYIINIFI
jgi:hypothetical protein